MPDDVPFPRKRNKPGQGRPKGIKETKPRARPAPKSEFVPGRMSAPSQGTTRNLNTPQTRVDRVEVTVPAVRGLAKLQCTMNEAAAFFGLSQSGFMKYLEHREFRDAWDQGILLGFVELRRLQWRHAQRPDSGGVQMTIHLSKYRLGERDKPLENLAEALKKGLLNPDQMSDSDFAALIALQEETLARIQRRSPGGLYQKLERTPTGTRH